MRHLKVAGRRAKVRFVLVEASSMPWSASSWQPGGRASPAGRRRPPSSMAGPGPTAGRAPVPGAPGQSRFALSARVALGAFGTRPAPHRGHPPVSEDGASGSEIRHLLGHESPATSQP
jgi:hypothetical protein